MPRSHASLATALPPPEPSRKARVLLVEDDEQLRSALSRALSLAYEVVPVPSAESAVEAVAGQPFDAVVSDVNLGGMDGLDFLRRLREADIDLPVLLMTGSPTLESAMRAVQFGAVRYMVKPLDLDALRGALVSAVGMRRLATARRQYAALRDSGGPDSAGLSESLDAALKSVRIAWQPIVSWERRRVVAYEALVRSKLPGPEALLELAENAGRGLELGRMMRKLVAQAAQLAPPVDLHVNLQPRELLDDELYDRQAPLVKVADRVVLELTERSSLEALPDVRERVTRLRKLGFRLALDDLGAGYAGLASFAMLEPEVVKIDISLVKDLHHSGTRRRLIASILEACKDLRATAIAEGVELPAERDALVETGCELFQGFLFAQPAFHFPEAKF